MSPELLSPELLLGLYYFFNDHLGTPQQLVTTTGTIAWQAAYLPYGQAQVQTANVTNNLRFPGQYFDVETGLHYNWHRFYDPSTGRYISADPIGLAGGINLYAYVGGDPINWIDPKGLKITPLGTDAEKALILSWLNTIQDCCDPEVQKRLRALEESANNYRIKFTDNMVRAGQYKNRLTEIDSDLKNPNSTTFWYSPPLFTKRPGTPYFQGPDTLAHELLGHGFDEENGYYGMDGATATAIANKVRDCLGQTRRGGWFDK